MLVVDDSRTVATEETSLFRGVIFESVKAFEEIEYTFFCVSFAEGLHH